MNSLMRSAMRARNLRRDPLFRDDQGDQRIDDYELCDAGGHRESVKRELVGAGEQDVIGWSGNAELLLFVTAMMRAPLARAISSKRTTSTVLPEWEKAIATSSA